MLSTEHLKDVLPRDVHQVDIKEPFYDEVLNVTENDMLTNDILLEGDDKSECDNALNLTEKANKVNFVSRQDDETQNHPTISYAESYILTTDIVSINICNPTGNMIANDLPQRNTELPNDGEDLNQARKEMLRNNDNPNHVELLHHVEEGGDDHCSELESAQPPYILKELEDCTVVEGEAAKFSCYISGSPETDIHWYKDDEKIQESREYSMLVESEQCYVLVITQSTPDIQGIYTFEATNCKGSVKSSAKLSVECLHISDDHEKYEISDAEDSLPNKVVEIQKEDVEKYYNLLDELGRGKFGKVFKCVHKETNENYAAKFIKCRPSQKKTVINEIDILNSLNHKCIIKLIAAFESPSEFVLVQELISGGELFEKLIQEEFISEMDVSFYMEQVLHALKHMHNRGILHLDLKPENIMLVDKNSTQIKLIDFGVAKRTGKNMKVTFGTAEFLAPEVINYDPVYPATDMWAVGVITYVLLSGLSPFGGDNDLETLGNISKCAWDFDDPVFEKVSDESKDFISKLLVKSQSKRATSEQSLEHPWFKLKATQKKIATKKLASFTARRNWRKSIAVVQTANYLGKVSDKVKGMLETVQEQRTLLKDAIVPEMSTEEESPPSPPCIVKEVENCEVAEGEAATFTCCIRGHPIPEVSWYKDDEKLLESKRYSMLVRNKNCYVLLITHGTPEIEGLYTCKAVNSEGSVKSSGLLSVESLHTQCHHDENELSGCEDSNSKTVEIKEEDVNGYFTILEELGRGAFGVVYKCTEKSTNQTYAAKFIKAKPAHRKSIINEIDILNSLNHKCIIKLVAAFEHSGQFVLVSELVSGGELFQRLVEEEFISEMDVIFYIKQVLHAARHMHKRGILHLDLKPENILIVDKHSTQIKLIDFGLACRTGKNVKVLFGTAEFISPEVINYQPVSPATDMWSIGVITYVLLSGYTPFDGDTESEILDNIKNGNWEFDDPVFDDISDEAKDFISKLIIRDPRQRASSRQCLEHPWLALNNVGRKTIRTEKLISFMARRNWRRSIAVVQTANYFGKLSDRIKDMMPNKKKLLEETEEESENETLQNGNVDSLENQSNGT